MHARVPPGLPYPRRPAASTARGARGDDLAAGGLVHAPVLIDPVDACAGLSLPDAASSAQYSARRHTCSVDATLLGSANKSRRVRSLTFRTGLKLLILFGESVGQTMSAMSDVLSVWGLSWPVQKSSSPGIAQ